MKKPQKLQKGLEMTDQEINIAIAKACGWKDCRIIGSSRWFGIPTSEVNKGDNYRLLPDYCNDMNAMHEAVMSLPGHQQENWMFWLMAVVRCSDDSWSFVNATARQRAEAFLRALDLWVEG